MTKILLVEDDDIIRGIIKGVLTDAGHSVVEAIDGDSGLAEALSDPPDVILCDFIMPGVFDMPDRNVFHRLASSPKTKDVPVVIMSGLPKETIQANVPRHMWDAILTKPFDYTKLAKVVAEALGRK